MNINNVFICYSKIGDELLLYRKNRYTFIDLLSKNIEIYPMENIDFSTMVFASNYLWLTKNMSFETIKNRYLNDREKMVRTEKYVVGCITEITNLRKRYIDSNKFYSWNPNLKYNSLFIPSISIFKIDRSYKIYKEILSNKKYMVFTGEDFSKTLNNGTEYVELFSKNLQDICNNTICDKKYIYEVANQLKQKSLIKYK